MFNLFPSKNEEVFVKFKKGSFFEFDNRYLKELEKHLALKLPSTPLIQKNITTFELNYNGYQMIANRIYMQPNEGLDYFVQFIFEQEQNECVDILLGCKIFEIAEVIAEQSDQIDLNQFIEGMQVGYVCGLKHAPNICEKSKKSQKQKKLIFYERDLFLGYEDVNPFIEYFLIESTLKGSTGYICVNLPDNALQRK